MNIKYVLKNFKCCFKRLIRLCILDTLRCNSLENALVGGNLMGFLLFNFKFKLLKTKIYGIIITFLDKIV